MKKNQIIESYNKNAKIFAKKYNGIGVRIEDIKKAFSYTNKINPKVVEIGCGNGRDAKEIVKYTSDYIGIDISKELLNIAEKDSSTINFQVADFESFIFPQNIDIVFAFASLVHTNEISFRKILNKVHVSLNIGGIFYVSLKYGNYHETIIKDEFGIRTYYFYTPEKIKSIMNNKFKIIYTNIQNLRGQKWLTIILQK